MKIISKSLAETGEIAKDFLEKIALSYGDKATVVGLYGDLGSGKTAFAKAVAKTLGVELDITSPTFVIEKKYKTKDKKFPNLIHIDAYRLDSTKEIIALDWNEILKDPRNLILIEWPERIADVLPENHSKIFFNFIGEFEREIEI
jgi:tRNA threonylcarbamoyladenosine biosynthesis protein TsaE